MDSESERIARRPHILPWAAAIQLPPRRILPRGAQTVQGQINRRSVVVLQLDRHDNVRAVARCERSDALRRCAAAAWQVI